MIGGGAIRMALGLMLLASSALAETPQLALVIGNAGYAALPALPGCAAATQAMTAALQSRGFDVQSRSDATRGEFEGAVGAFARRLADAPGAAAVIYVCGYAAGLEGRAFLLPVSAALRRDSDVLGQGVVAKTLQDLLIRGGVKAGLVVLDGVAQPGTAGSVGFDRLGEQGDGGAVALLAAMSAPAGDRPMPLGTAVAAELSAPELELHALLQAVRQRLPAGDAPALTMRTPADAAWLVGPPALPPVPQVTVAPRAGEVAPPGLEAPKPEAPEAAATATEFPDESRMTDLDRRRVQGALATLGYYSGRVDARFGAETRAAIRRFQHEIGAELTGRITPEQALRLFAMAR